MRPNGVFQGLIVGLPVALLMWYLIYLVVSALWGV